MRNLAFRFKKFECQHSASSIKIGVDAVLLGAWAELSNFNSILDVGTGCGVITLMCAQRNPDAIIKAIDIDPNSINEAHQNFNLSPWADRLTAQLIDFNNIKDVKYDLIISNPPYFHTGITSLDSSRMKARHQDNLSPSKLLQIGKKLLTDQGEIALILPFDQVEEIKNYAKTLDLHPSRICFIYGHPEAISKRAMIQFTQVAECECDISHLVLESQRNKPTPEYRQLCKDFYLKF